MSIRRCPTCGSSIEDRRKDAIYCGGPCRAEASRERAVQKPRGAWDDLWDGLVGKGSQTRTDRGSGDAHTS
jgi:hypothetical protein